MFGTIVIILQDTKVGRLHVDGLDLPEIMEPGDVIVIDPTCYHKVQSALRERDRRTATIVL